jgi:ubiquinone biosynthesis accessory factor UbiJ
LALTLDLANRLLERESWAREKLAAHASRTVSIGVGPARRVFKIGADGWLLESDAAHDLAVTISPLRLPALLAQPERWNELVVTEGDAPLAASLAELALTLPWFVEELFARAFGRAAGQQLADIGRRLLMLPTYAAERFGDSVASYVGEEAQLAVSAAEAGDFAAEIAALAERVDALGERIELLGKTGSREPPVAKPPGP